MSSLSATPTRSRAAVPSWLRTAAPGLLAAVLAAVYLLWEPASIDLAAAEYRSWLFGREGLALYDLQWYGGHHMPGYSVLFPPLGWLLGPRLLGALCAVASAVLFERLARGRYGANAWLGALWFAGGTATILLSGRLTFGLGLVPALGALLAIERGRAARTAHRRHVLTGVALGLAVLTALASPVAAIFLAMAATAYAVADPLPRPLRLSALLTERRLVGLGVAGATIAPVGIAAIAFPEGGVEPFVLSAYWPVLAVTAAALWLVPREQRALRAGVVLYALGCTAAFVLDTPVGGNSARLGALCAGPLFALVLWPRRRVVLALVALPLLFWQWTSAYHDVRAANGDPSVEAAFYAPLNAFLDRAEARGEIGRVEIPFTKLHWESRHVAPTHELARGWERQLDHKVNPLFYDGELTPARYRAWLHEMAVRWVALPDTRFDYSARAEARLVAGGLPYLREAWSGGGWKVYAVEDPTPLVSGPARIVALGSDSVTLDVARPATLHLRMHWTPYWALAKGDGCVAPDGREQTQVRVRRAGEVRLVTRFAIGRIAAQSPRCTG
ncbi:hypothetical protein [Conexibacter woesei]|uniref:Uncharacterized protein n=1 Tax=Conexibacter woesei (strain DSM 14684 / CCUG 47730 / CIP 108061 / JCM 11494 / NBRC 100937 / ID131577) TaxID=469383 RepID=D3FAF7_CONWI|nr:hypothetical protein [Conexibacter woesei]ADB49226.1 hypothetical protein Cwoe_0793 [Conexibacter woesei DSM 14684]